MARICECGRHWRDDSDHLLRKPIRLELAAESLCRTTPADDHVRYAPGQKFAHVVVRVPVWLGFAAWKLIVQMKRFAQ